MKGWQWDGMDRWDAGKGRGKGKGGKAGRAPGKELFASNDHTFFLLVEIGFCSALFNVWLQLGRISVGGMSDAEERMAVQEMMDGDVYLLTGACVEMAIALVLCLPVLRSRGGFWLCKGGEGMRLKTRCIFLRWRSGSGRASGRQLEGRANNEASSSSWKSFRGMSRGRELMQGGQGRAGHRAVGENGKHGGEGRWFSASGTNWMDFSRESRILGSTGRFFVV